MLIKKLFLFCILLIFLTVPMSQAKDNKPAKNKLTSKERIEIVSDRMDAFNEKKLIIFAGNAVATQGDKKIKADRLLLYYKKDGGKKDKVAGKAVEGAGDLDKIEAKGNVIVTQKQRVATGDEAVYFHDSEQIVMTGNPVLRDGKNTIKGDKVIVYLNEDRGVVESNPQKKERVKAVIYPQEKEDKKENKD
jgi:lipopolysaccharide export system protein LptA